MKLFFLTIISIFCLSTLEVSAQEDSVRYIKKLPQVKVESTQEGLNDTMLYRYNQYKYYVKVVWPYVLEGSELLKRVDDNLNSGMSRREQKRYIKSIEDEVKMKFEDKLKSLNRNQGAILVKLMNRQIGSPRTIFSILQQVKGKVNAQKWQSWAKLYGMDLKEVYNPETEPKLEGILRTLGYIGEEGVYF